MVHVRYSHDCCITPEWLRCRHAQQGLTERVRAMNSEKQPGKQQGVEEAQQDRKQDEVAKQRPAQTDQKIHDAETRRPERKDNNPD
jgi:hypothetical protein